MNMYQKRKQRQKDKIEETPINNKMNINWYPGHMTKTRRQIEEDLKLVDLVVEILDARIPVSSQNPDIGEIVSNKKKIVILNKSDLADERENQRWIECFKKQGITAVLTDSNSGKGIENSIRTIESEIEEDMQNLANKGRVGRKIRAMVIGIPNVGKSSYINRVAKKTSAGVGNKPGVTKQKQWIRVNDKVELLDTPGVLWPKFESNEVGFHLAFTGTIKEEILDRLEIAYQLTKFLLENYQERLIERYKITKEYIDETLNQPQAENSNIYEIMLEIGKNRGCIMSGGKIDEEKTARIIIDEFKNGVLGKVTIEKAK